MQIGLNLLLDVAGGSGFELLEVAIITVFNFEKYPAFFGVTDNTLDVEADFFVRRERPKFFVFVRYGETRLF